MSLKIRHLLGLEGVDAEDISLDPDAPVWQLPGMDPIQV